jgi:hypothetical protein
MSTGKLRCWGDGHATPIEVSPPANAVKLDAYYANDRNGVLWARKDSEWEKVEDREHVRTFDARDAHVVTVHDDGTVRVLRSYSWKGPEKGPTLEVPGLRDTRQVISANFVMSFHVGEGDAGADHGCALDGNGDVRCWLGELKVFETNMHGTQLVNAYLVCSLDKERRVSCALPYKAYMEHPSRIVALDGARSIAGGETRSGGRVCGVFDDNTVACVEFESSLIQIGDPKAGPLKRLAVPPVDAIAVGTDAVYVKLVSGAVLAWGTNDTAQLGDGTYFDRTEPVAVKYLLDARMPPSSDGAGNEPQDATEMDWTGMPDKCRRPDEIRIGEKPMKIVSAYAKHTDERGISIVVANFRTRPGDVRVDETIRGSQQVVYLFARRSTQQDKALPLTTGVYKHQLVPNLFEGHYYARVRGESFSFRGWTDVLKIAVLTKQWVCGTLELENRPPIPFVARFVN